MNFRPEFGQHLNVYVNNTKNHGTLAIEVIAKGGFNDRIEAIMCLPEGNDTVKRKYDG